MRLGFVCMCSLVFASSILWDATTGYAQQSVVLKSVSNSDTGSADPDSANTEFKDLPAGWSVIKAVEMSAIQVDALASRWDAESMDHGCRLIRPR